MKALPILNDKAAGIDVGSESLHVSIAGDVPRVFGTMTCDLAQLREYLLEQRVRSAALEATGVYWLCAYEALEAAGIEVLVVNGRHVKNVPGRKSDMADCQWLATVHAHGLLRSGFVPDASIRRLQDYMRLRQDKIGMAASHVQHMQKALERMNIKFHDVISSLTGKSGLAVIKAILDGERDPQRLLSTGSSTPKKGLRSTKLVCWRPKHAYCKNWLANMDLSYKPLSRFLGRRGVSECELLESRTVG